MRACRSRARSSRLGSGPVPRKARCDSGGFPLPWPTALPPSRGTPPAGSRAASAFPGDAPSGAAARAPNDSGRRSAQSVGELVETAVSLRTPDQVTEERRIRALAALVRRDAREVEERQRVRVAELELRSCDVCLRGQRLPRVHQPDIHEQRFYADTVSTLPRLQSARISELCST